MTRKKLPVDDSHLQATLRAMTLGGGDRDLFQWMLRFAAEDLTSRTAQEIFRESVFFFPVTAAPDFGPRWLGRTERGESTMAYPTRQDVVTAQAELRTCLNAIVSSNAFYSLREHQIEFALLWPVSDTGGLVSMIGVGSPVARFMFAVLVFLARVSGKLRRCEAAECTNLLLPKNKGGHAKYCGMRCQNRTTAARYRAKHREQDRKSSQTRYQQRKLRAGYELEDPDGDAFKFPVESSKPRRTAKKAPPKKTTRKQAK